MVFKYLRKHLKIIFILIIIFMIIPFLFWGMSSVVRRKPEKKSRYYLRGRAVSRAKFIQAYNDIKIQIIINFINSNNITAENFRLYRDWINQIVSKIDINHLALQQLAIEEEAKKYGISTNRKEVAGWISKFPIFTRNGQFDTDIYQALVPKLFNIQPVEFERSLRRILSARKLQTLIVNTAAVSTDEVYEEYKKRNEKAVIYYTVFNPADYITKVKGIKKDELENYYQTYKEKFREPEKIKIAYLIFDPKAMESNIKVTDKEIEDYYNSSKKEFKNKKGAVLPLEKVKNRIKKKIISQKAKDQTQQQAIAASIKLTTEKRFGDMQNLAKEENIPIKISRFISKREYISELGPVPELAKTVWPMELETISDIIPVKDKWIIASPINRIPSHIPKLSEVKAQVTEILKYEKAKTLAYKTAQETLAKLPKGLPFTMAVKAIGLKIKKSKPLGIKDKLGKIVFDKKAELTGRNLHRPIVSGNILFCVRAFHPVKEKKWEKEKEKFKKTYLEEKKKILLKKWLTHIK